MTDRINYWGWIGSDYREITSEREYDEYTVSAVLEPDDEYESRKPVNLTLYVDAITGLVVSNIGKYEASL